MSNNFIAVFKLALIAVLVILFSSLVGGVGYFIGRKTAPSESVSMIKTDNTDEDRIFNSRTASITGQITQAEKDLLTVKNTNNGETRQFKVASNVRVLDSAAKAKPVATSSASTESFELNRNALISLEFNSGDYEVRLVQYINQPPPLPEVRGAVKAVNPANSSPR